MVAEILPLKPGSVGAEYPPLDPDQLLRDAIGYYSDVLIIGIDKEGKITCQMSHGTEEHAVFLMERLKQKLLSGWWPDQ